jgi:hypothetical protein
LLSNIKKNKKYKKEQMDSIAESMRGINGDGWGTTLSKEEQLEHQEYVRKNFGGGLNAAYEKDREREMAQLRGELDVHDEENRDTHLSSMKTSFIDGFLPKEKQLVDFNVFKTIIEEIKARHTNNTTELQNNINILKKHIMDLISITSKVEELRTEVAELKAEVAKLKTQNTSFFGRMTNWFSCFGRDK